MNDFQNTYVLQGKLVDNKTRCVHYHSTLDIIAIKFKCCDVYFPCYECHAEAATHQATVWQKNEWFSKAILCGNCKTELTIREYMDSNNACPLCKKAFNPKCREHYHLYFEI